MFIQHLLNTDYIPSPELGGRNAGYMIQVQWESEEGSIISTLNNQKGFIENFEFSLGR